MASLFGSHQGFPRLLEIGWRVDQIHGPIDARLRLLLATTVGPLLAL
jgi:hypothetical protein